MYVGSFCSIAPEQNVFVGGNHRTDWATTFPFGHAFRERFPAAVERAAGNPTTKGRVVIENDVWIGLGCTIMSGVTIGSGSVIATKSVVTKDVPSYAIVGGNPARLIRMRYPDSIVSRLLELQWWSYGDQCHLALPAGAPRRGGDRSDRVRAARQPSPAPGQRLASRSRAADRTGRSDPSRWDGSEPPQAQPFVVPPRR